MSEDPSVTKFREYIRIETVSSLQPEKSLNYGSVSTTINICHLFISCQHANNSIEIVNIYMHVVCKKNPDIAYNDE